jgi:hypothetical protein
MKKNIFLKSALAFFLYIVLHLSTQAQSQIHKYFIISGKILSETEFMEPGEIRITKKDSQALKTAIPTHGRFRLELNYNTEYQVTFTQVGRLPKTIVINTEIPEEVYRRESNFPHFLMAVKLANNSQNVSNSNFEDQKQQITYSSKNDCFIKVPTAYSVQVVDKINHQQASAIESQQNKEKLKIYQVF